MDLDFHVTQYFLFLLDMCKDPKDVFACNSAEVRLAQTWLEKLCLLSCENLEERRLRNVYLSYLCACLNTGILKGPFLQNPPEEKLDAGVDFNKEGTPVFDCSLMPVAPECPRKSGTSNLKNCTKPSAKKAKKKSEGDNTTNETVAGYMYETITNYPDCLDEFPYRTIKSQKDLSLSPPKSSSQVLREDVTVLMDSISAELRGDSEPGQSEYLERELTRYKEFIMNYSSLARAAVQREHSQAKLRSFLLLNLQNDLVKLLTDNKF